VFNKGNMDLTLGEGINIKELYEDLAEYAGMDPSAFAAKKTTIEKSRSIVASRDFARDHL